MDVGYGTSGPGALDAGPLHSERIAGEEALCRNAMWEYGTDARSLTLIRDDADALVWRVETPDGPRAFTWNSRPAREVIFALTAHYHLERRGFLVPALVRPLRDEFHVTDGKRIGFLTEWIDGRPVSDSVDADQTPFVQMIADFHRHSRGMDPSTMPWLRTYLGGWPLEYKTMIGAMRVWAEEAKSRRGIYFSRYRDLAPAAIRIGETALERLVRSAYWDLVKAAFENPTLCWCGSGVRGAVLTVKHEVYVTQLNTVAFDLPVRDLRAALDSVGRPDGRFGKAIQEMLETYLHVHRLTADEVEVFLIDAQFPYAFFRNAASAFQKNRFDVMGLDEALQLDGSRAAAAKTVAAALRDAASTPDSALDPRFAFDPASASALLRVSPPNLAGRPERQAAPVTERPGPRRRFNVQ